MTKPVVKDTFMQNMIEACVETFTVIAVYAFAMSANNKKKNLLNNTSRRDLGRWVILFTICNALLKTVHPKFDNSFLSAAMINIAGVFLAPFKK